MTKGKKEKIKKIRELPSKIKIIEPVKELKENLESELEEAELESFENFMKLKTDSLSSLLVPEDKVSQPIEGQERKYEHENKAPEETPTHMKYEHSSYTTSQKAAGAANSSPVLGSSQLGERRLQTTELERFREEHQREQQSEQYSVEASELKVKRKNHWER